MLFNSYEFIFLFLPITLLIYVVLVHNRKKEAAMTWLVAASLFFYGWWNPAYLLLIIGSMLFNYYTGVQLSYRQNRLLLGIAIAVNLGFLGYFKYANFFVENISNLAGLGWNIEHIVLPLAISFFTFQQIAYLVDAYRRETSEYNFLHYALFVSFFPQLIAGPIVHHKEMLPQFIRETARSIEYRHLAIGISVFILGLFKKVVIADSLAPYSIGAFEAVAAGEMLTFFEAWKGALAYTFQLYFDFSGYSDMAIGLAMLFGIRLPLNFNSPYKAGSIIEFWQRWHITLSRFLRDYLYIPLGGNRKGHVRRYLNLVITMLLGGLWHGAEWTFVFWGGLHGLYLVINHGWRRIKELAGIVHSHVIFNTASLLLTFFAVVVAWVFFRAEDFSAAILMLKSMSGYGGVVWPADARGQLGIFANTLSSMGLEFGYPGQFNGLANLVGMIVILLFVFTAPNVQQLMNRYPVAINPPAASTLVWAPDLRWGLLIGFMALLSILRLGQMTEFLYFQF
jgi:D-alanyl-lipoteichoic acid acyltransferase DltB (MBOAT superfamily)